EDEARIGIAVEFLFVASRHDDVLVGEIVGVDVAVALAALLIGIAQLGESRAGEAVVGVDDLKSAGGRHAKADGQGGNAEFEPGHGMGTPLIQTRSSFSMESVAKFVRFVSLRACKVHERSWQGARDGSANLLLLLGFSPSDRTMWLAQKLRRARPQSWH